MKKLDHIPLDSHRSQKALPHFANEEVHQPEALCGRRSPHERVLVAEHAVIRDGFVAP